MIDLFPQPPDWRVPWDAFHADFDWVRRLRDCPQDPVYHAEGDVWIHTRMVCESLAGNPQWRALNQPDREIVFAAALMHDIAKPDCTRHDGGQIRSPGHAVRGAIQARRILWEMAWPRASREAVAALVRHHMTPYRLLEHPDAARRLHFISQTARCDWLALVSAADVRGRVCPDRNALLDNVALCRELAEEEACLTAPRAFPSPHSRFVYFRKPGRDPHYAAHDDCRGEMIVLCGLPGAGKDTWIRERGPAWPVVSLDELREKLDWPPTGDQGPVVAAAREAAKVYLRQGQSLIWNSTNLSRELRGQVIDLAAAYRARIRIVAVEAPAAELWERNSQRERPVPPEAIERLLARWSHPDLTEAHEVDPV